MLAARAGPQNPVLFGFVDSDTRFAMRGAVEGAAARLARRGCQDVLSDLTDESGERLSTTLVASEKSPDEAFVDCGSSTTAGRRNAAPARRYHNVHTDRLSAHSRVGTSVQRSIPAESHDHEIIVIHEFLRRSDSERIHRPAKRSRVTRFARGPSGRKPPS